MAYAAWPPGIPGPRWHRRVGRGGNGAGFARIDELGCPISFLHNPSSLHELVDLPADAFKSWNTDRELCEAGFTGLPPCMEEPPGGTSIVDTPVVDTGIVDTGTFDSTARDTMGQGTHPDTSDTTGMGLKCRTDRLAGQVGCCDENGRTGVWQEWRPDDNLGFVLMTKIAYLNGKKNGKETEYSWDGTRISQIRRHTDDLLHGEWTAYHVSPVDTLPRLSLYSCCMVECQCLLTKIQVKVNRGLQKNNLPVRVGLTHPPTLRKESRPAALRPRL